MAVKRQAFLGTELLAEQERKEAMRVQKIREKAAKKEAKKVAKAKREAENAANRQKRAARKREREVAVAREQEETQQEYDKLLYCCGGCERVWTEESEGWKECAKCEQLSYCPECMRRGGLRKMKAHENLCKGAQTKRKFIAVASRRKRRKLNT